MTTLTTNWSPEGAFRTAARRMKKHGLSDSSISNTLLALSPCNLQTTAKGNIKGAIKRCVKHGIDSRRIYTAMINVAVSLVDNHPCSVAKAEIKPVKATRERTPEQVKADKERMAYVRSCRKDNHSAHTKYPTTEGYDVEEVVAMAEIDALFDKAQKVTHPEDLAKRHGNVAPSKNQPSIKAGSPIVINSFKELDALLQELDGII